jgi:hypothetical protein
MTSAVWTELAAGLLLALALTLGFAARRALRRWQRRRQWQRAQGAEFAAPRLLEQHGYGVIGAQVEGGYSLVVDGAPSHVSLRADYVVVRKGRRYVAEVKSGRLAPRLETAATRRQLLEYRVAFDVDGVLLVDAEARRVHQVEFPVTPRPDPGALIDRILAWVGAAVAVAATLWWLHGTSH